MKLSKCPKCKGRRIKIQKTCQSCGMQWEETQTKPTSQDSGRQVIVKRGNVIKKINEI